MSMGQRDVGAVTHVLLHIFRGSVRDPSGVRPGSVWDPSGVRPGSVQGLPGVWGSLWVFVGVSIRGEGHSGVRPVGLEVRAQQAPRLLVLFYQYNSHWCRHNNI